MRVKLVEDLDRLGPQAPVELAVVLIRQLAGPVVELGVADLAVLGVPGRVELGQRPLSLAGGEVIGRDHPARGVRIGALAGARAPRVPARPTVPRVPRIPARRSGAVTNDATIEQDRQDDQELHPASPTPTRGPPRPGGRARRTAGTLERRPRASAGTGHRAIRPPIAMIIAPSQIQVTSGETMTLELDRPRVA